MFSSIYFNFRRTRIPSSYSLAKSLSKTTLNASNNVGFDAISAKEQHYSDFLKNAHRTSDLFHGKAVHAQLIKNSCMKNSTFLQNFMLSMYMNFRDFNSAVYLFDEMSQRNVVSWTSVISGFVRHGFPEKGLFFFASMLRSAELPNEFTLVAALKACSFRCFSNDAYGIYGLVIKLGFECNVFIRNAFLSALIKSGVLKGAITAFNGYLDKDIVSWNAMISGYLQFSPSEIPGFLLRMIREGVKPDGFTFSTVFSGLAEIRDVLFGMQVHGQLVKYGHGSETCVGNSVVDMYLNFGNLVDGFKAFEEIHAKNVQTWTTMATGCLTNEAPNKALEVLSKMKTAGVMPNRYSVATTFKACATIASLNEGEKAHSIRIKLGSEMDTCVDNALLDMYVKCGCMDDALKVFRSMKDRTIITWTTMVMGFAQNGLPREALGVFNEMVNEGFEPNYVTFVCVLYACSQAGYVEEGWKYFSSMSRLGILPGEDHYICMVDLLGRAGRVKDAEELISKMPFTPGPLVWQSLLGSCQIHGDIETGKRAAASLMRLNQSGASTYVTLSNMFASSNNWEGSEALRDIMQCRKLTKNPVQHRLTNMEDGQADASSSPRLKNKPVVGNEEVSQGDGSSEDAWFDDDCDNDLELHNEWKLRKDKFYSDGYREGIIKGQEDAAQDGFNLGFKDSVMAGYKWGIVRGITSALANMPDEVKEKLVEKDEVRSELLDLHGHIDSMSTEDALKLFYDNIKTEKSTQQSIGVDSNSSLTHHQSDGSLETYFGKLDSLLKDSSGINVHLEESANA